MSFLIEFLNFLKSHKKLWLFPIFFIMIIIGFLLVLVQGTAVAPFIYTLF